MTADGVPSGPSSGPQASQYLILGTAGHIDHGKTTLVKALTGKNTDRLPEEQKRGITIELGFAHLSCPPFEFGIVDVPGHQRFVKTMLAGSTGVDLVMLVVAADDSINRQTREHLDILRSLDIPAGVIALTKCDRVDSDWLELVEQEVRELVQDCFLADAPIIRTSATAGTGLDELKQALISTGEKAARSRAPRVDQPFRMPVDRVFSIPGHGTVVTGSVTHGHLAVGQSIQILPEWPDREIRVRQLQTHDRNVEQVVRGQRAAVNLAGVSVEDVQRGFQLVAPGQLPASNCLTVQLTTSEQFPEGIADHQAIRLHLATSVVLGKVRFLQARSDDQTPIKVLPVGQTILAQLLLDRPVLAAWGQRMVVRRPSPAETLGHAIVVDPCLARLNKPDAEDLAFVQQLSSDKFNERLAAFMYFSLDGQPPGPSVRTRLAIPDEDWDEAVTATLDSMIAIGEPPFYFHSKRLDKFAKQILKFLDQQHTLQPKRWFIDRAEVQRHMYYVSPPVVTYLLKQLQTTHQLRHSATGIGLPDRGPNLTKNQGKLLEQLLQLFRSSGLQPPSIEHCIDQAPKNKQDVVDLLKMATESGDLVRLDSQTYLAAETLEEAWQQILPSLMSGEGVTVSEIRDRLGITRKLAVPLCEFLDQTGRTQRNGDLRVLGPQAQPKDA